MIKRQLNNPHSSALNSLGFYIIVFVGEAVVSKINANVSNVAKVLKKHQSNCISVMSVEWC